MSKHGKVVKYKDMKGTQRVSIVIITVIVAATFVVFMLLRPNSHQGQSEPNVPSGYGENNQGNNRSVPAIHNSVSDLQLPFILEDISPTRGEVNPLGVVRFSKDEGSVGHPGIDIPLTQGAPIYAVADGLVIQVKSAGDPWGGQGVFHLLEPTRSGEGWAYVYEHITPVVTLNQELRAGELVGHKTAPDGFTAHFQLSYIDNDYKYTRGAECWPELLKNPDRQQLQTWWEQRRATERFLGSWRTNDEEGAYPFRGLLNPAAYPNGAQLCYPLGTDVR